MAANEQLVFERARKAYERGRASYAAVMAVPLIALSVIARCLGADAVISALVGVGLLGVAWALLWRGQTFGRAVLPGVFAGLIPLALSFGARAYGHVCTGGQCVSLCIPACTIGGVAAGLIVARASRHTSSPVRFCVGAGALASLVGSLGCSCVGYSGVMGLVAGLTLILFPAAIATVRLRA